MGDHFRITSCGAMVVATDTHVGLWVERQGRLDHDLYLLPMIVPLIPENGTVIDGGALYGDHTLAYARKVGPHGSVFAFEPNPEAFTCLRKNMETFNVSSIVTPCQFGLSDKMSSVGFALDENTGASHIVEESKHRVPCVPLDQMTIDNISFIKLDIEGFEVKALRGAAVSIMTWRPVIVAEVNRGALERQGDTQEGLLNLLREYNYRAECIQQPAVIPEKCRMPQFDIIAYPV